MKKRKTIEEREDEEEQKAKYVINTDLIEGFLNDQDDIQDETSLRNQAIARLSNRDPKKPAMIPNQAMASVQELRRELEKSKGNVPLQLSILETLVSKASGQEKLDYLEQKIGLWLITNKLQEAENDAKSLLGLQSTSKYRLLYSRILNRKKDALGAMTLFLRCGIISDDISINELYNSIVSQLQKSHYFHTMLVCGSNIHYTLGDGTQESASKPRLLPELKGKIVLSACCGDFHSLIIASSCLHIANQTVCPNDLGSCNEGVDIIGWGDNSHGQLIGNPTTVRNT
jgi:Regulator of chromosome condensation (RCC1) repeat